MTIRALQGTHRPRRDVASPAAARKKRLTADQADVIWAMDPGSTRPLTFVRRRC